VDKFILFGIIAGFTERVVTLTDDPTRLDHEQVAAVLRKIGAGLSCGDVTSSNAGRMCSPP
jgi:hypothetical protein